MNKFGLEFAMNTGECYIASFELYTDKKELFITHVVDSKGVKDGKVVKYSVTEGMDRAVAFHELSESLLQYAYQKKNKTKLDSDALDLLLHEVEKKNQGKFGMTEKDKEDRAAVHKQFLKRLKKEGIEEKTEKYLKDHAGDIKSALKELYKGSKVKIEETDLWKTLDEYDKNGSSGGSQKI